VPLLLDVCDGASRGDPVGMPVAGTDVGGPAGLCQVMGKWATR